MSDKIFVGIGCRTRGQVEVRDEVEVKGGDWGGARLYGFHLAPVTYRERGLPILGKLDPKILVVSLAYVQVQVPGMKFLHIPLCDLTSF